MASRTSTIEALKKIGIVYDGFYGKGKSRRLMVSVYGANRLEELEDNQLEDLFNHLADMSYEYRILQRAKGSKYRVPMQEVR